MTDTTPPVLVGVSPSDGLVDVPINPLIEVKFDEPIYVTDLNGISLERFDGLAVATKMALLDGSTGITLRPLSLLEPDTQYRVKIDSSVTDSAGNAMPLMTETLFTTGAQADPAQPEIVSITPIDDATGVAVNTTIVVTFDEVINPLSFNESTFRVFSNPFLPNVAGTFSFSSDQKTVTFTPDNILNGSTLYRVLISDIRDLAANELLFSDFDDIQFTTEP